MFQEEFLFHRLPNVAALNNHFIKLADSVGQQLRKNTEEIVYMKPHLERQG
jgi:5-bromo-4-chloroindolyl phosphate hydrolysis protein